ncbi:MAG: RNA polymerase sigma-70 factor [Bacteroidota bacterium]
MKIFKLHNEPDFKTSKGFEEIYNTYIRDVYLICFAHLKNKNECQEISQEIFRSLWERREMIQLDVPIGNYLRRAAKLKVIDFIRRKEREDRNLECMIVDLCVSENSTEDAVSLGELKLRINNLVDKLPCRCREVFKLSREKGLSIKEIASTLLISENTVKVHLTKALSILREELSDFSEVSKKVI